MEKKLKIIFNDIRFTLLTLQGSSVMIRTCVDLYYITYTIVAINYTRHIQMRYSVRSVVRIMQTRLFHSILFFYLHIPLSFSVVVSLLIELYHSCVKSTALHHRRNTSRTTKERGSVRKIIHSRVGFFNDPIYVAFQIQIVLIYRSCIGLLH